MRCFELSGLIAETNVSFITAKKKPALSDCNPSWLFFNNTRLDYVTV